MPVIDGTDVTAGSRELNADVCIIGAGAAGIYLGLKLAEYGTRVVILEAGPRQCEDSTVFGADAAFEGATYRGALEGRAFGLGGSTSRWGGVLVPHTPYDVRVKHPTDAFNAWHHIVEVVKSHEGAVLETLGLGNGLKSDDLARRHFGAHVQPLASAGIDLQVAQYLPFRQRNLAYLLPRASEVPGDLTVVLNAVAKEWGVRMTPDGVTHVKRVTAAVGEQILSVNARHFTIAAGALESARILLELQRQTNGAALPPRAAVGRYLGDHLSCPIARVEPENLRDAANLFRPRFEKGRMFYFRLLENKSPIDAPRSFAHFIFEDESAGFALAKKVLGGLQARAMPNISPRELIKGLRGLIGIGWNRMIYSQLHIPSQTPVRLQLDVEQAPNFDNHIRLADRETDEWGRPLPVIAWEIKSEDYEAIRTTAKRLLRNWSAAQDGVLSLREVFDTPAERKLHDAYHPVGVCRLGTDEEAVVDPDLTVRGTENLSVLSTAVFPSAGTANPTFSILCLGERLSKHVHTRLGRKSQLTVSESTVSE